MTTQHELTIASLHERFDAFADAVLAELRALRAQAPEPALYCPRETVDSYEERKGGRVLDAAPGTLLCPGGFRLQLSRSNVKPDSRQAADDFFHALPEGASFTAQYGQEQRFTMRHHNVWRSVALSYEQAWVLGLPGLKAEGSGVAGTPETTARRNGASAVRAHSDLRGAGTDAADSIVTRRVTEPDTASPAARGPSATTGAERPALEEPVERLLGWARKHWGSELSVADVTRAAGGGDWHTILDLHGGDWRAVAATVHGALSGRPGEDRAHAVPASRGGSTGELQQSDQA